MPLQWCEVRQRSDRQFHAWLQWTADGQLATVQRLARELGMSIGLYGDYAVGVNPAGSETWSDQLVYRMGAGVGAPPDPLALKGQDWGIPPQDPNVLTEEQYRPFRQLIAGVDRPGIVVARFLAVLELYRHAAIGFEQIEPLGELTLRWAAGDGWTDDRLDSLGADYDE